MSSAATFAVVALGVVTLLLWYALLYVRYQIKYGEPLRAAQARADFGPLFELEPAKRHIDHYRSAQRFGYTTDWQEMKRQAGRTPGWQQMQRQAER